MSDSSAAKPASCQELALLYGVSTKILRGWLKPHLKHIGPRTGRYYTIQQVQIIFDRIGPP